MLLPFEIDDADFLFVSAANATSRSATIMIAPAGLLANLDQALLRLGLRNIAVIGERYISRRRRQRSKCLNWHKIKSVTKTTKSVASKCCRAQTSRGSAESADATTIKHVLQLGERSHQSWAQMSRQLSVPQIMLPFLFGETGAGI